MSFVRAPERLLQLGVKARVCSNNNKTIHKKGAEVSRMMHAANVRQGSKAWDRGKRGRMKADESE
jgi:hypothetical protein